jgi:HEAT repeat protein
MATADDGTALFRAEVIDVPLKLLWKGPALSDETRFAVAASGLSWSPVSDGTPLFRSEKKVLRYEDGNSRLSAFQKARQIKARKEAFAFALSLVLDPPNYDTVAWVQAFEYLRIYDADFDKALIGVLQAPEKLPVLPAYQHAVMDALVHRASPRLLPLFLNLAEVKDPFLRSRAIVGLGVIGYRARTGSNDSITDFRVALHENGISAVQQRFISQTITRAAQDSNFRVRAAAALALGLTGDEEDLVVLKKLAKDKAYIVLAAPDKSTKEIVYPVRYQAARSLARFKQEEEDAHGTYSGKALGKATRGGQDITKEVAGAHHEPVTRMLVTSGYW